MKRIILLLTLLSLFTACKKSKRNLEEDIKIDFDKKLNPSAQNIAVISNNDVYYFADLKYSPVRLTNSPNQTKSKVKVSYDGSKVIFQNSNGYPEIRKSNGELVEILTGYYNPDCFNWSADGNTIYFLDNNTISFHGPALKIPVMTDRKVPLSDIYGVNVSAVAISPNMDILYTYTRLSTSGYSSTYESKTVFKEAGSNEELILSTSSSPYSSTSPVRELNFANVTNDMIVSTSERNNGNLISNFSAYGYKSKYIKATISSSYSMINPVYRSDLSLYVCGTYVNSYSEWFSLALKRASNYGAPVITLSDHSGTGSSLYCDWK